MFKVSSFTRIGDRLVQTWSTTPVRGGKVEAVLRHHARKIKATVRRDDEGRLYAEAYSSRLEIRPA